MDVGYAEDWGKRSDRTIAMCYLHAVVVDRICETLIRRGAIKIT